LVATGQAPGGQLAGAGSPCGGGGFRLQIWCRPHRIWRWRGGGALWCVGGRRPKQVIAVAVAGVVFAGGCCSRHVLTAVGVGGAEVVVAPTIGSVWLCLCQSGWSRWPWLACGDGLRTSLGQEGEVSGATLLLLTALLGSVPPRWRSRGGLCWSFLPPVQEQLHGAVVVLWSVVNHLPSKRCRRSRGVVSVTSL
jgi:hypothetical protein